MTRIIRPGRNAWRETSAEDSGLLVDAADYYRMFYWAAERATRYLLISGWQFDSGVPLLRGADALPGAEVRFLKFLNGLCEQRPGGRIINLSSIVGRASAVTVTADYAAACCSSRPTPRATSRAPRSTSMAAW